MDFLSRFSAALSVSDGASGRHTYGLRLRVSLTISQAVGFPPSHRRVSIFAMHPIAKPIVQILLTAPARLDGIASLGFLDQSLCLATLDSLG
jgi:hypothetical protein